MKLIYLCALLLSAAGAAQSQPTCPNKPIRIVVPYVAGGAADITARIVGQKMTEGLRVPVIIDNKPGANGMIGTDAVAKAAPDGYTLVPGHDLTMRLDEAGRPVYVGERNAGITAWFAQSLGQATTIDLCHGAADGILSSLLEPSTQR